jgi:hypothetical protein
MFVSEKRLAANRANAQKSTGPRTPEGKARSRNNAVIHGLRSQQLIINSPHLKEDLAEFHALLDSFVETFNPRNEAERSAVLRIALCIWRQQRATIAENAHIERQLHSVGRDFETESALNRHFDRRLGERQNPLPFPDDDTRIDSLLRSKLLPSEHFSRNLLRYELRTDKSIQRALEMLRIMKANRSGKQPKTVRTNPVEQLDTERGEIASPEAASQ